MAKEEEDTVITGKESGTQFGVLVVDDEEHLALMFRDALVDHGYACDAVFTPLEALKRLKEGNYAILVSDVRMPNMTGLRLMQEARAENPHLKTIFVTGFGDVDTAVAAMKKGASDFLRKPFDLQVLLKKVDAVAREIRETSSSKEIAFEEPDTNHCPDLPGYRVMKSIGVGAMGSVFLARQVTLKRDVAIKLIRPTAFDNADALKRFKREARAAAKMNHPNIIQVYDLLEVGRFVYLIMEYFPSESLSSIVKKNGRLSPRRALWVTLQITRALIHASSQDIIHRDVKPPNILIGKGWTAKLADFGLAKHRTVVEDARQPESPTRVGSIVGTPAYMSPEQAAATPDVDVRSDIYSLGLCLFFMLEAKDPYVGDVMKLVRAQLTRPLPELQNPEVPESLRAVLQTMTAKDPEDRFENGGDLLLQLRRVSV